MTPSTIPNVCLIEDICRELKISRRTLQRLRRHGAFPIPELPSLDKHPRWSGADVEKFLARQTQRTSWGTRPAVPARSPRRPQAARQGSHRAFGAGR
jgi:helix-turn-helix protein